MSSLLVRSILPAVLLLFGCSPMSRANLADYDVLDESESSSTSWASSGTAASVTEDSESSPGATGGWTTVDTADTDTDSDTDGTSTGELAPSVIDDYVLTPNPIEYNGAIAVTVWSDSAEGVRMELDDGSVSELLPTGAGVFEGQILALSGLSNGARDAVFQPWRADAEGEPVVATYEIALGTPGDQGLFETGDVIGIGRVPAMAVHPSGVLEFGSLLGNGTSRCYARRRTKGGAWGPDDLLYLFPDIDCRAIDLEVDEAGAIFFLVETMTNSGWRWSLHKMPSWGAPFESIGYGGQDETANALARSPGEGALAVCGAAPTIYETDESDAMVQVFREDVLGQGQDFDYVLDGDDHRFAERANGCEFLDDKTVVVVGEAYGEHGDYKKVKLNRRFDLFYDLGTNSGEMRVAKAGLVSQSVASDVDIGADGKTIVIVGHICDEVCEPEGKIWTINAQGDEGWSASLGLHAIEAFAPHDVASSPAGYVVIASGGLKGSDTAFTIRAFALGKSEPLWVYSRKDADLLHVALTVAIGVFGEVYAGGFGANGYPAVAYIFG